ncbi:Homoserine dehydrogenase [Fusarium austroafricanum]|uniref:Homoserine dehydrogenase n=1 Tax=Fusarium austroafricanum TaxID=2364996 RepID=A0A8H4KLL4_9HYPO|nr:Homoserine dehydrogenase [Fusarium austroafricanum]
MSPTKFNIAILGVGGVTKSLLPQLQWLISQPKNPKMNLVFIANSSKAVYNFEGALDIEAVAESLKVSEQPYLGLQELLNQLAASPNKAILIDSTGTQQIADAYPEILRRNISIVTPSKKAFAGSYQLWQDIFAAEASTDAKVYIESSVGAGLPMIKMLKDLLEAGDEILRIEGVLSGTMTSIFSSFAPVNGAGVPWSVAVKQAKELGFTEPDPRDDLNGMDVARKLIIFARLVGLPVDSAASVPIQSLVPKDLEALNSANLFLERLFEYDSSMDKIKADAEAQGKIPRYIGSIDLRSGKVNVGMEFYDKTHSFAGVSGSDNIIGFHTKRYPKPLILQGAGAGGDVTAMGIIGGLVKVSSQLSN